MSELPRPVARPLSALVPPDATNPNELLKHRFLCRGGGALFVGPTGVGKSSLSMQAKILWALGRDCFGITPAKPLSSLLIQAENDDDDLCEMRDGVANGLKLTSAERELAFSRILIFQEDGKTAKNGLFPRIVEPLIQDHRDVDLLWMDCASAYHGGSANDQENVTAFLRHGLQPLLRRYSLGGLLVHHSNKPPSGKEKSDWSGSDFAYLGAGAAEWAQWARAIFALRSLGSSTVYELRLAKRGARVGWKDFAGEPCYTKNVAHSKEHGQICWREAEETDLPAKVGRPKSVDHVAVLEALGSGGLTFTEWAAKAEEQAGVKLTSFKSVRRQLLDDKKVFLSPITSTYERTA